ncbi:hypothetical protein PINS_up000479 [Pythium insidiosum]|nr:hypothetical protein PINS_up000479 [Pythium insidiosum]
MSHRPKRETRHHIEVTSDLCVDFFSAIKTGFLQEKSQKGWYEGWNNRWIVLQDGQVSCYENSPRLDFIAQFQLRKCSIFTYDALYLFRVVSRTGTTLEMRVRDQATFNHWLEAFALIPSARIIRNKDLLENSPSAVLLMHDRKLSSSNGTQSGKGEWLVTKIEGYDLQLDDKSQQFVTYAIQVISSTHGTRVVNRRYSEFGRLHRRLRQMFPHEQIPAFPGTRMWGKFDPTYLKEKTVRLHGYLGEVCKRCAGTRGQDLLLEFLDLAPLNLMRESTMSYGVSDE